MFLRYYVEKMANFHIFLYKIQIDCDKILTRVDSGFVPVSNIHPMIMKEKR